MVDVDTLLRLAGDLARAEKQYRECPTQQKAIAWKIMEAAGDKIRELIDGLFIFNPMGNLAICLDEENALYGWYFVRGPEKGQWVSERKATEGQLNGAKKLAAERAMGPSPLWPTKTDIADIIYQKTDSNRNDAEVAAKFIRANFISAYNERVTSQVREGDNHG